MNGYVNLTVNLTNQIEAFIIREWVESPEESFFVHHVLAREGHLVLASLNLITCALDIITGLGMGAAAIVTADKPVTDLATKHLMCSTLILSKTYSHLLGVVNPEAQLGEFIPGLIANLVKEPFENLAGQYRHSADFFERHIVSRLVYALAAIATVIARVVDGIIGAIAASLSLITLGTIEPLNNVAIRGLTAPGVVNDLFLYMLKLVNPCYDDQTPADDEEAAEEIDQL